MIVQNAKYSPFDRNPPAGLEDNGVPSSEVLRALATTASIFESFHWRLRPLGRGRRFVWDAPEQGAGVPRATGETSDSCAGVVFIEVPGNDPEMHTNDLALFLRLLDLQRKHGIGRLDIDLLTRAVRDLVMSAAGYDASSMPVKLFATLVGQRGAGAQGAA